MKFVCFEEISAEIFSKERQSYLCIQEIIICYDWWLISFLNENFEPQSIGEVFVGVSHNLAHKKMGATDDNRVRNLVCILDLF